VANADELLSQDIAGPEWRDAQDGKDIVLATIG
jgi:hypothetical protein